LLDKGLSQRRGCELACISRSSFAYEPVKKDDTMMIEKIKAFSKAHPREGSIKAYKNLRREGVVINHKKVERIWRQCNLGVMVKRRQRRRGKGLKRPISPLYPNHVWSYDFMEDSCINGRKLRILNIVDEFSRECVETYVDHSIPAKKVIEVLEFLFIVHGRPDFIRSDNGPEFVANILQQWLKEQGTSTAYIEPGKPWQNGIGESYNSRLRDECLNMEIFYGLKDSRVVIEDYRQYYNEKRLHGGLGYIPPHEFKQQWLLKHEGYESGAPPQTPTPSQPNNQQEFDLSVNCTSEICSKPEKVLT
jgi:putative transposase